MFKLLKEFKSLWYEDIIRRKKATPFIVFVFFLLSFIAARVTAYLWSGLNYYGPYHIHHFFYGIVFVIISNWIALVGRGKRLMWLAAGIFGAGLGMIFDEIGMIIICGTPGTVCDPDKLYWLRFNYDIIMYVFIGFLLILYFKPFWDLVKKRILYTIYRIFRFFGFKLFRRRKR